jgi:hypothetical protein
MLSRRPQLQIRRGYVLAGAAVAVLFAPIVAGAATTNTTISTTIASVISVTSSGTVTADVTPTVSGAQTTSSDSVSVTTNDSAGYTLQLEDANANTSLVSGGNTIDATTGTQASPIALTAGRWGYRVDGVGGFGAGPTSGGSSTAIGAVTYAGVPASGAPNTLKTTATTASADITTVWYSVAANATQPTGTYSDTVTYTALAN